MSRRRGPVIVLSLLIALVGMGSEGPARAEASGRPYTLDDLLRTEDLGRAVFYNSGSSVLFERMPAYEARPGPAEVTIYSQYTQAGLRISDAGDGRHERPAFAQRSRAGYWLGSISPDRKHALLYTLSGTAIRAGILSLPGLAVRWLPFSADFEPRNPGTWLGNRDVVVTELPPGTRSDILQGPRYAEELRGRWARPRSGRSSVSVIASGSSGSPRSSGSTRPGSVLLVHVESMAVTRLADGRYSRLSPSPSGMRLAALAEAGVVQPADDRLPAGSWRQQILKVIGIGPGSSEPQLPCPDCSILSPTVRWADGDTLTFLAHRAGAAREAAQLFRWQEGGQAAVVEVRGFQLDCLIYLAGSGVPQQLPEGGILLFGHQSSDESISLVPDVERCDRAARNDWFLRFPDRRLLNLTARLGRASSQLFRIGRSFAIFADGDLWMVEGASLRNLTQDLPDMVPLGFAPETRIDGLENRAAFQTADNLIVFLEDGSRLVLPKLPEGAQLVAVDGTTRTTAYRLNGPGQSGLFSSSDRGTAALSLINQHLRDVEIPRRVTLAYQVQGSTLSSCLLLPAGYRDGVRVPLVVVVYPGASGDCVQSSPSVFEPYSSLLFSSAGYGVLFAAAPSRLAANTSGPNRGITPLVMAAADQAISEGYADPDRLAVFGISQGMHEALQVITETGRFRAAIVGFGFSDFGSGYNGITLTAHLDWHAGENIGFSRRFEGRLGDSFVGNAPWSDPQRYLANSPVFSADRITTPLLIMHSDFDIFPLSQSEEMFAAMFRLRRDAELAIYWGEGHGTFASANVRDSWSRMLRWLATHMPERSHSRG